MASENSPANSARIRLRGEVCALYRARAVYPEKKYREDDCDRVRTCDDSSCVLCRIAWWILDHGERCHIGIGTAVIETPRATDTAATAVNDAAPSISAGPARETPRGIERRGRRGPIESDRGGNASRLRQRVAAR